LERVVYEDQASRYRAIAEGVTYGDAGDSRVQNSIKTVLNVISEGLPNGRVVSKQAGDALTNMFESVRADIIAEHFAKEHNAAALFPVAKELDDQAHGLDATKIQALSVEAKAIVGVFADFVQVKRTALLSGVQPSPPADKSTDAQQGEEIIDPNQAKLL
jgi:hypothetical protein